MVYIKLKEIFKNIDCFLKIMECEEPGCKRAAVKVWHGRQVCEDHYDYYRDREAERFEIE